MTNWITIDDLKKQLVDFLKNDIKINKITCDFQTNSELQEKLDENIDLSLIYNEDQSKLIQYYGYWDIKNNVKTLAQLFDAAVEDLITDVWEEIIK